MNQFKLTFQLEKPFLSKDFEVVIISFLKAATLNYAKDFHEKLYDKSQSVMKSYTFSCYLPNARFQKEQISLGQPCFELYFSDADIVESIQFLNSFKTMYKKKYPMNCNSMQLVSIAAQKRSEIKDSEVIIKMSSSLVVRSHDASNNTDKELNFLHLKKDASKLIARELENSLKKTIKHKELGRQVSYQYLIRLELYKLIKHIIGEKEYEGFKIWW